MHKKNNFLEILAFLHYVTIANAIGFLSKHVWHTAIVQKCEEFQKNDFFRNFRQYLTNPGRFALHVKVKFHEKTQCLIYFLEDYNLASKRVMFFVSQNDFKTENRKQVPHHEQ